jgi:ATP-dependent HslUV protease subunit HslV
LKRKNKMSLPKFRSTTVIAVKKDGKVAMAGDGQVTMGETVMKGNARKVRRIFDGKVLTGFAGATADAFNLFDKFEAKLKEYNGDITRAAVELAKIWRTDKALRNLEALLLVANADKILLISGTGDVIEPESDILAIGSGGNYALAAARALVQNTDYEAKDIAYKALKVASEICVYTNDHITVEEV